MKKMLKKSKGFTLVELLIVIIIIGILAGMMMLATGSATDKAEATKVVSNLRNIKAGCVMYYADHNAWPGTVAKISSSADLYKYLDQKPDDAYGLEKAADGLYVKVDLSTLKQDGTGVQGKLKDIAKDSALHSSASSADSTVYQSGTVVYMPVN